MEQLLTLALHHSRHGYARPTAHHLGDVVGGHLLADECLASLSGLKLRGDVVDVVLQALQLAIFDLGHLGVVALALGLLSLEAEVLHLLLVLLNLVHQAFLAFPFSTVGGFLILEFGDFLVELFDFVLVVFALDGLTLNFELFQLADELVEFLRHTVALHT